MNGRRKTSGARTQAHHAATHRADVCWRSGLDTTEETVIKKLHEIARDFSVTEARVDAVMARPGGLQRWLVDVRAIDGLSETAAAKRGTRDAMRPAENKIIRKNKHEAYDLAVSGDAPSPATG